MSKRLLFSAISYPVQFGLAAEAAAAAPLAVVKATDAVGEAAKAGADAVRAPWPTTADAGAEAAEALTALARCI